MLSTIETRGDALLLVAHTPELADHLWTQRRRLLQLTGAQRLLLTIDLGDGEPLQLPWTPPPLPAALPQAPRRPARFRRPAAPVPALSFL